MADISIWVSPDNQEYNYKDAAARTSIADLKDNQYSSSSAFPAQGEVGKNYIAKDTGICYRWDETVSDYVAVGMTSAEKTKLNGIEDGAQVNPENATASAAGLMSADDKAKLDSIGMDNAGYHNSVYRGKSLGTSVSSAQWTEIKNGTFHDMFVGDYWTINNIVWRIAGFDYWLHTGNTECVDHHVVIVPDVEIATAMMNNTQTTGGAYLGSNFYTGGNGNSGRSSAIAVVNNAFGSSHILSHPDLMTNATNPDAASNFTWANCTVELMSEVMVYGTKIWGNGGYEVGCSKSQLPLFQHDHSKIGIRSWWWLRSVASRQCFSYVDHDGPTFMADANAAFGIRPAFAIYQSLS